MIDATELTRLLRVNTPLLSVDSAEEMPVLAAFKSVMPGVLKPLMHWSITQGLRRLDFGDAPARKCDANEVLEFISECTQRSVFLLFDFEM